MRVNDVRGGWVRAWRNLSLNLETWWRWERRQQLARCSNVLPCDVLGHETNPPQRWGLWPEDAGVHCWRGGIALIQPDSWNDVYFLKGKSRWQRGASLASLGMREICWSYRRLHSKTQGWWHIYQQRRKSQHPSMSLLPLAKVSQALLHPFPLVTHYRLLCPRMPGGLRPSVFTCASDKARLCASSPGAPRSCWPGPPQPKAPSGLGPGPPVSSP